MSGVRGSRCCNTTVNGLLISCVCVSQILKFEPELNLELNWTAVVTFLSNLKTVSQAQGSAAENHRKAVRSYHRVRRPYTQLPRSWLRWELYDVDFSQSLQTLWAVTLICLTCVRKSLLPGKYADLPGGSTPPEGCELFAYF